LKKLLTSGPASKRGQSLTLLKDQLAALMVIADLSNIFC
jgi:hypothetical protein